MFSAVKVESSQANRQQKCEGKWYSSTITDDDGGATHRCPSTI